MNTLPTIVIVTINYPNESWEETHTHITSLDELEVKLTQQYPEVQSFVFVWSVLE